MSTCNDCYGTNTTQPCESVGCLSTNYGKCITYSGLNLFCEKGAVSTFTFTGTAVSPTVTTTVEVVATGGTGEDITFNVTRTAGEITYLVTLVDGGSGYTDGDTLTIAGTALGGTSPANNITITVTALAPVIANGTNLDEVIENINQRLCLISSEGAFGLDYNSFNYSCLRLGGNLESTGSAITTAQGFVESTASALCSLNTRVKALEKPAITVASCFTGTLTSGTSTLVQILNEYGTKICTLNTNVTMSGVTSNPCSSILTWTSKPTSNNIADYINWINSNVCQMSILLNNSIIEVTEREREIREYITGNINGIVPLNINTSCLTGGSTTSSLKDAVNLIVSQLCSTISTVSGLGSGTTTVTYGSCFTAPYAGNSVFGVQGLGSFTATTTIQTHLNQLASALSALNIKVGTGLTLTNSTCGPIISLASGSTFSCSSLSTCSINNLGDIAITSPTNGQFLTYNTSTSKWQNTAVDVLINGSATNVTKNVSAAGTTFDLNVAAALSGTNYYYRGTSPGYASMVPNPSALYPIAKPSSSGWAYIGITGSIGNHIGGFRIDFTGAQTFVNNNYYWMYTFTTIPFNAESEVVVPATIQYFSIGTGQFTYYPAAIKLGTDFKVYIKLLNNSGNINCVNGDYFEVIVPTFTFTI